MPIFKLGARVTVSAYTEVDAPTLEEAIEEAAGRSVELSYNGSGNSADEVWLVEEADGTPEGIHDSGD